jgi:hypothetical protein
VVYGWIEVLGSLLLALGWARQEAATDRQRGAQESQNGAVP